MITQDIVKEKISQFTKQPISHLQDQALLSDIITESFVLIEMVMELQEEFKVRFVQEDLQNIKTVSDLTQLFLDRANK